MGFCTTCGSRLEPNLKFCTQCGSPVSPSQTPRPESTLPPDFSQPQAQPTAGSQPPSSSTWQTLPAAPAQQPPPRANTNWLRAAMIALFVVVLLGAIGIGGVIYVGYKVKQKATAALHRAKVGDALSRLAADPHPPESKPGMDGKQATPAADSSDAAASIFGNLAKMMGSSANTGDPDADGGDPVPSVSENTPVDPCPPASFPSQDNARIPLQEGTVLTTAWGVKYQDVESRITIGPPTPVSITTMHKTGSYKDDYGREREASKHDTTVCNADIASASSYVTVVGTHIPPLIHGVTRVRMSDKSFGEVKSTGSTSFEYTDFLQAGNATKPVHDVGLLSRVEPQDVSYPMILNDERVTIPAIHLAGTFESRPPDPRAKKWRPNHAAVDLYVLDDAADPLVLLWKEKDPAFHDGKFRVEVVKIDYKPKQPVNLVEKQLTEKKRAVTYGIYFDFNKDTIKPESEPVLKQIVQAMSDNPAWKLTVEGHTDNIGGDNYNLDLSRRRAAAVKQALVTRYHISADRLSNNGFGASRPVETNETLEGRARNRRVELTRE